MDLQRRYQVLRGSVVREEVCGVTVSRNDWLPPCTAASAQKNNRELRTFHRSNSNRVHQTQNLVKGRTIGQMSSNFCVLCRHLLLNDRHAKVVSDGNPINAWSPWSESPYNYFQPSMSRSAGKATKHFMVYLSNQCWLVTVFQIDGPEFVE